MQRPYFAAGVQQGGPTRRACSLRDRDAEERQIEQPSQGSRPQTDVQHVPFPWKVDESSTMVISSPAQPRQPRRAGKRRPPHAMASLHRSRQWLEAFKFSVYLGAPVAAVYALSFGKSGLLERSIENRSYVMYPPEGPQPPSAREVREVGRQQELVTR
jgi:protein PET100, fungi type